MGLVRPFIVATCLLSCACFHAPDAYIRGVRVTVAGDTCVWPGFEADLETLYDRGLPVDVAFGYDVVIFDEETWPHADVYAGMHFNGAFLIHLRYPSPRILAHEFTHAWLQRLGEGEDSRTHGPLFQRYDNRIGEGLPWRVFCLMEPQQ